ncbi:hypothetical protein MKX01_032833 [Papaver californicum]|nr:hypothetical protein MKX01_032833 [Papaver californicum]
MLLLGFFPNRCIEFVYLLFRLERMAAAGMLKPMKQGFEEPHEQLHRIRITLSSKNVKNLEKDIKNKGPVVRMPAKTLHITTRKTPGGEGKFISPRLLLFCYIGLVFELCVHKRVIDHVRSLEVVKQISYIIIEPGVEFEVEVTIVDP